MMFKKIKCVLLISTVWAQMGLAATKVDSDKLNKQMMYFYQNPNQQQFKTIQQDMMSAMPANNKHVPAMVIWAYAASQKYGWTMNADFYPALTQQLHNPQSKFSQFIADDNKINPTKLDMWWSSFFATGEEQYVRKVFKQAIALEKVKQSIDNKKTKTKQDLLYFAILASADWSFKANCRQHAKIRTFARQWQRQSGLTAEAKQLLTTCVSGVQK